MEVPPHEEWISLSDAAKLAKASPRQIRIARRDGLKSVTGEIVHLECWKTPGGWVTTKQMLSRFIRRLNL